MLAAFHLIDSLANLSFSIEMRRAHYGHLLSDQGLWNCYVDDVSLVLYGEAATVQQRDEVAIFLKAMDERGVPHRYLPAILQQRSYVDSLGKPLTDANAADSFLRQCIPSSLVRRESLDVSPDRSTDVEGGLGCGATSSGRTLRSSIAARFRCDVASTTVEFDGKKVEIKSELARLLLQELMRQDGRLVRRATFEAQHRLLDRNDYGNALRVLKRFDVVQTKVGPGGGCYLAETAKMPPLPG